MKKDQTFNDSAAAAAREKLIELQQARLRQLKEHGWTLNRIAAATGASLRAVTGWNASGAKARLAAAPLGEKLMSLPIAPPVAGAAITDSDGRGRRSQADLERSLQIIRELGFDQGAAARVRFLHEQSARFADHQAFARWLGIGADRLSGVYLDPDKEFLPALNALERLRGLHTGELAPPETISLADRLQQAGLILFGEQIVRRGFDPGSYEKQSAIEKLAGATKLSARTIRRWLPPYPLEPRPGYQNVRYDERIIRAFERAASGLGKIV